MVCFASGAVEGRVSQSEEWGTALLEKWIFESKDHVCSAPALSPRPVTHGTVWLPLVPPSSHVDKAPLKSLMEHSISLPFSHIPA